MKTRGWLILLSLSILLPEESPSFCGGTVLQIENPDRGIRLLIRTEPSASFSFSFIHSMYLEPATEEFEWGGRSGSSFGECGPRAGRGRLLRVEEGRTYYPVNRKMNSFVMRLG